ncbi:Rad52/22 family double-strand break repair protein-domain-containing protein [Suillus subaureus]|uniref:Rad52/22 family double-strand break repair protein-domain-containing protein n=1 Tax=Suillus subaureus TaxID=48587 RepID=A0A9P7JHS8_9AGAM|nr:Rad52/22 family double-strand break repair protein-domain-containing protein [Suillus subaureus]KAG1823513.1 Rad52/22 family double-strand break repair protein-domain-containing protein [Suillus subaureus]
MAGAFSGHLLDSYNTTMQRPAPGFGQPQSRVITSGTMSFDASMHGSLGSANSFSDHSLPTDMSDDTAIKIATLQAKLNKKLGPEYISQRPGPGGGPKLTYAEGWKIINIANEVFGFNGWSSQIVNMTTDYMDYNEESKRCNVGVSCIVRVTLSYGVFHEDVGYGAAENAKGKAQAIDKSKKEAVTDALKRALRNFGSLLGNCLYDKSYTQEITKIKVPPAKFVKSELYRRPEFDDTKPNIAGNISVAAPTSVQAAPQTSAIAPDAKTNNVVVKSEPPQGAEAPITYIPRHLRQEMASAASGSTSATPSRNDRASGNGHGTANGLNTPIHTPVQRTGNANRGQYRQTAPSLLVQPEQRRVSFTEPAAEPPPVDEVELPVADETSYSIDSEDDEFYANVDLGDGDLGRPINFEEGMGGESVSDVTFDQGEAATSGNPREPSKAPQGNSVHGREISSSGRGEVTAPGGPRFSHSNAPRFQPGPPAANTVRHGLDDAGGTSPVPPRTHESSSSSASASSSEARRGTPSIGGFHFPPGMNLAAQQSKPTGPPQPPNWTTGSTSSSSNISGLKRKADTIQASSSSSRPLQGLGLAQQQQSVAGNPNGTRRPLANLDDSAGSDMKRQKR